MLVCPTRPSTVRPRFSGRGKPAMTDTTLPAPADPPRDGPDALPPAGDESLTRTICRLFRRSQAAHLDAPMSWVWHGYVTRHQLTLFTGQWKIGKTTLL